MPGNVVKELPTSIRAELLPVESMSTQDRTLLVEKDLTPSERALYGLGSMDQARHIEEVVELSGLTSSEVLAVLFDREMRGLVRQLPGKQFPKVLL